MEEVVGISFDEGRIYYFDPNGHKVSENITVIVETEQGLQFGKVKIPLVKVPIEKIKKPLKKIIRIATKKDYNQYKKNQKDAQEAKNKCQEIANKLELNMKIIDSSYTFDRDKLIFRFLADARVDFRDMAKELAKIYKVRIELRQIGVRDKAKEVGGFGPCGRKLCCSSFLKEMDTVTINMAKNQNISLNPTKINGVCGRLMCCLKYEDENYTKCRLNMKKIGDKIKTEYGIGIIQGLDILRQKYKVDVPEYGTIEVDKNESNKLFVRK